MQPCISLCGRRACWIWAGSAVLVVFLIFQLKSYGWISRIGQVDFERSGYPCASRSSRPSPDLGCARIFVRYEPSPYENSWYNDIEEKRHRVCDLLSRETEKTVPLMTASYVWSHQLQARELPLASTLPLFSRLIYNDSCTNRTYSELIEPLFGMLRDPFSICQNVPMNLIPQELFFPMGGDPVQSKAWILSAVHAPTITMPQLHNSSANAGFLIDYGSPRIKMAPRRILIDLGSNLFNSWNGATSAFSTAHFHRMFASEGVPFDRIFAYEYEKLDPHSAWEVVPEDAFAAYTLINHGVESDANSKFNPWNLLRQVATPEDFVVVKLDIDSPSIESSLFAEQLLEDQGLIDLVDEMYFEHHVYVAEMEQYWGITASSPTTLALSYQWFQKARKMGIRMHSWP